MSVFVVATGTAADEGMMFALDNEPGAGAAGAAGADDWLWDAPLADLAELLAPPASGDPLRALRRAVQAHAAPAGSGGEAAAAASVDGLAGAIAALLEGSGVSVAVRSPDPAAAAGAARAGRPSEAFVLRGRFVVIKYKGDDDGVIVDPAFREAFRAAPATPGYQRLVDALPAAFVGDPHTLRRITALMTAQAARSFEAQGLTTPPWRRYSAMAARWFPPRARYTDTPVTPPASPLKRLDSGQAVALALAEAGTAARGAIRRLAGARGAGAGSPAAPEPARVVRGFELPPAVEVAVL